MSKERLYALVMAIFIIGHTILIYCLLSANACSQVGLCPFKATIGLPCPSCGSTRAVLSMLSGHPADALYLNPLGVVTYLTGCLASFTILYDCISGKSTFYRWYQWMERTVLIKPYAYLFILIIIMNWIWNITKGL